MKLNTNGNAYTFCYAAVMVIIVAFLLAFVASALKETQDANVANDTKGQILTALGYDKAAIDVAAVYAEKVQDNVFDGGELKAYEGSFNTTYGSLIKNGELHVFTATTANGEPAYVLPVVGRGLWGGLWGYIAVSETKDKVLGTYFYHERRSWCSYRREVVPGAVHRQAHLRRGRQCCPHGRQGRLCPEGERSGRRDRRNPHQQWRGRYGQRRPDCLQGLPWRNICRAKGRVHLPRRRE